MIWTPDNAIETPAHCRLSRWFKRRWPPGWGWPWAQSGCGCCVSAPSTHGCLYNTGCCANVPATVHVTFSNTGKCPPLDGKTFTLTIGPCTAANCTFGGNDHTSDAVCGWSSATQTCTGTTFVVSFGCIAIAGGQHFAINVSNMNLSGTYTTATGGSVTCSPFNVVIDPNLRVLANGLTGACSGGSLTFITATITP